MSETIDVQATTTAIATRPQNMAVGQAMGINEILSQVKLIQDVMKSVMTDGEHYGTIPGCGDKKTLLQPGAQKLTMTFRLAPEYQIQEVNLERGHKEYRVICTLKSIQSGSFVGQGVGCCSSMESKYRWRGGARRCPQCGKETIIKGKAEYGGGWLCFQKKGGCGQKWPDGAAEIESQSIEKIENDNPADTFNTVLKMAKKRAFVDATITATAASDIFTQDVGDDESDVPQSDHQTPTPVKSKPVEAPTKPEPPKPEPPKFASEQTRLWMIKNLFASPGSEARAIVTEYFRKLGKILPNEELEDLPLEFVPISKQELAQLTAKIAEFESGQEATEAFPPHDEPEAPKSKPATQSKPDEVPRDKPEPDQDDWRTFPMPFGKNAGVILEELDKKYLYGLWANYEVEEEYNGKPKKPEVIARDTEFRRMLDLAGEHYEFTKQD